MKCCFCKSDDNVFSGNGIMDTGDMELDREKEASLQNRFVRVAMQVCTHFPGVDLRFNRRSGSRFLRYRAIDLSKRVFKINLERDPNDAITEAIFKIKEIGRFFDA